MIKIEDRFLTLFGDILFELVVYTTFNVYILYKYWYK